MQYFKFLIPMLFICSLCYGAAPTISGIEGTYVNDYEDVTISGSNFGTKTMAEPILFDDFEDGSLGSPLSSTANWVMRNGPDGTYSDGGAFSNSQAYSGTQSAHNDIVNGASPSDGQFNTSYTTFTPCDEVYYWRRIRTDTSGDLDGQQKLDRIGSEDSVNYYSNPAYKLQRQNLYNWTYTNYGTNDSEEQWDWGGYSWSQGQWQLHESYVKISSAGVSDGAIYDKFNNVTILSDDTFETMESGGSYQYNSVLLGLMWANTASSSDHDVYIDDVYIDNTQSRVIIGNNATYSNCTSLEIQYPITWADTAVGIKFKSGKYTSGTKVYMFVFNSDGDVNETGYEIEIGETGTPPEDPLPPSATGVSCRIS